MKSIRLILQAILISVLPSVAGERGVMQQIEGRGQKVDEFLERFDTEDEPQLLREAYIIVRSFPLNRSRDDWEQENKFVIEKSLRVLEKCYEARDHEYDLLNPPPIFMKVAPPLGSAEVTFSGMDPKGIKDPEIRRQYEEAIAENDRRRSKHRRERHLQNIIDRGIKHILMRIEALPSDEDKTSAGASIIFNSVNNERLREKILNRLEAENEEQEKGGHPIK
jgi:hypothetical protein